MKEEGKVEKIDLAKAGQVYRMAKNASDKISRDPGSKEAPVDPQTCWNK